MGGVKKMVKNKRILYLPIILTLSIGVIFPTSAYAKTYKKSGQTVIKNPAYTKEFQERERKIKRKAQEIKEKNTTYKLKTYAGPGSKDFTDLIPDNVTSIIFTDEIKPDNTDILDVDDDGDGGVVAWIEDNGKTMKVSTQKKGQKVEADSCSYLFAEKENIESIDLTMLDTKDVTEMDGMFEGCENLKTIDLTPLNTDNVENMSSMFEKCKSLTALDISCLNTSKVTDMTMMFSGCEGLKSLDVSNFDTSKVKDMMGMFSYCKTLSELDLSSFDTSNVTDMSELVGYCSALRNINLSSFNTEKVETMEGLFAACKSLETVDLSSSNTKNVTDVSEMFYDCEGLKKLDLSTMDFRKVTDDSDMFESCDSLAELKVGSTFKQNSDCYLLLDIAYTWKNSKGEELPYSTYKFPENVADTYTKVPIRQANAE